MIKRFTLLLLCISVGFLIKAQNTIKPINLVNQVSWDKVQETQLFNKSTLSSKNLVSEVENAQILAPITSVIKQLQQEKPAQLQLEVPLATGDKTLKLHVVKVDVLHPAFQVRTSDGKRLTGMYTGSHYRGIIAGEKESVASISVLPNGEIMGLASHPSNGTYVIGKLRNMQDTDLHIAYNSADLKKTNPMICETISDNIPYSQEQLQKPAQKRALSDCIKIYIEVDYDIYQSKGSVSNATAFATGIFNQSATFYSDIQVNQSLSEVYVWTSSSPYNGSSTSDYLSDFQAQYSSFNGDLAQLITFSVSGGIAAGFSGICNSNSDNSMSVGGINSTYETVPTYSWTVDVFAHELGHLHGSRHTHACVWNGNGTQIDDCGNKYYADNGYTPEGDACYDPNNPIIPSGGGTIMSYCHLQSVGKDFTLGFDGQVANVIQNNTINGSCLQSCDGGGGGGDLTYCDASGNSSYYEYIDAVSIGNLSNSSGDNGGFADYTGMTMSADLGDNISLTLTPGYTGSNYTEYWRVWIDFNQDGDFNDAGEQVFQDAGNTALNGSFTVPSSASTGTTRMRIAMQYNSYASACGTFSYGEVEDYTVDLSDNNGGGSCENIDLSITLDNYPEETSWEITDNAGNVVAEGGTYGNRQDGSTVTFNDCIDPACYEFTIYDSYGDGICCYYGSGSYTLSSDGQTIASGGNFGSSETTSFCLPVGSSQIAVSQDENTSASANISIYPQPAHSSAMMEYRLKESAQLQFILYDLNGRSVMIHHFNGSIGLNKDRIDLSSVPAGVYHAEIHSENGNVQFPIQRIMVMK